MKAQAIKEHLFAEDVHFFKSDEQRNGTGSNNRAEKWRKEKDILAQPERYEYLHQLYIFNQITLMHVKLTVCYMWHQIPDGVVIELE